MINQQVKVGVANNVKRGKMLVWHRQSWCGNGHTCHTAFSTHGCSVFSVQCVELCWRQRHRSVVGKNVSAPPCAEVSVISL